MNIDDAHKPSVIGEDKIHLTGEFDFDNSLPALQVAHQLKKRVKEIGGHVTINENGKYFEVYSEGYLYICLYDDVEDYEKPHVKRIATYSGDEKIDDVSVEQIFKDHEVAQKVLEHVEFSIE